MRTMRSAGPDGAAPHWWERPALLPALCAGLTLAVGLALAVALRAAHDPDGTAYADLARALVAGDLGTVARGCWSPLLPLLMAPAMALGADPFVAGRVIGALAASTTVVAVWLLVALVAGGLIGLSALAKSLLLPVFALALAVVVDQDRSAAAPGPARRRVLLSAGLTVAAAALPVVAWTAVVTARTETFAFTTAGTYNWALNGPVLHGVHPVATEGLLPPPHRFATSVLTDTATVPLPPGSTELGSAADLLGRFTRGLRALRDSVAGASPLLLAALLAVPLLLRRPRDAREGALEARRTAADGAAIREVLGTGKRIAVLGPEWGAGIALAFASGNQYLGLLTEAHAAEAVLAQLGRERPDALVVVGGAAVPPAVAAAYHESTPLPGSGARLLLRQGQHLTPGI